MYNDLYSNDKIPRFCSACGDPLEKKSYEGGYDPYTGERVFKEFLVCPRARLNYSRHDGWEIKPPEEEIPLFRQQYSMSSY